VTNIRWSHEIGADLKRGAMPQLPMLRSRWVQFDLLPLLVAILFAGVAGSAVATLGPSRSLVVVGASLLLLLIAVAAVNERTLLESLGAAVLLMSALVDVPRSVNVGPITALGVVTIGYVLVAILIWIHQHSPGIPSLVPRAYNAFVAWAVISFSWHPPSSQGFQNVAVFAAFALLATVTARASYADPRVAQYLARWLDRASVVAVSIYLLTLVATGFGTDLILSARGFALFGLLGLARALGKFRYQSRGAVWVALAIVIAIAGSLSRTALAICLLLAPLAWLDRRSISRRVGVALAVALSVGAFAFAAVFFGPLHSRFLEPNKAEVAGSFDLSVSGRAAFWGATWRSFLQDPWIGNGAGSSEIIVQRYLTPAQAEHYTHPHNDYLRLLHDYGVTGAGLWFIGYFVLLRRVRRAWVAAAATDDSAAAVHMTAFLAMVAIALSMITDNAIVYIYLMAPLGLIVGSSLGLGAAMARKSFRPRPHRTWLDARIEFGH
jgi:O-antigen ligase